MSTSTLGTFGSFVFPCIRVTKKHDSSAASEKKTPYILFLIRRLFHQRFHQTNLTLPKTHRGAWVKDARKGDSIWKSSCFLLCYIFQQGKRLPISINTHWLLFDRFKFVTGHMNCVYATLIPQMATFFLIEFEGEIQGELQTPTKTVASFFGGGHFGFGLQYFLKPVLGVNFCYTQNSRNVGPFGFGFPLKTEVFFWFSPSAVVQPHPPPSQVRSSKRALAWKSLGAGRTNFRREVVFLHQQSWNNLKNKQIVLYTTFQC